MTKTTDMARQGCNSWSGAIRILFLVNAIASVLSGPTSSSEGDKTMNVLMRNAKPLEPDAYLCTAYPVEDEEIFVHKFEGMANASTAHHMLLYGCDGPDMGSMHFPGKDFWPCSPMCAGRSTILFAWAKNAPATVLPKDVGLRIGKKTTIKTLVLQVHYARAFKVTDKPDKSGLKLYLTSTKPHYIAGILLMLSSSFSIPPHTPSYPVDMSCIFPSKHSIFPFAYRTHSHGLGKVITGYQYNGSYHEIGKGNPQWPQAFYPAQKNIEVKHGDYLAARCTYDSSSMSKTVSVGPTGSDEMCNFYIMFYTDSSVKDLTFSCISNRFPSLTGTHFPADVSVPLPHNETLEEEAKGHHHHHGGGGMHHIVPVATPTTASQGGNLPEELSQQSRSKAKAGSHSGVQMLESNAPPIESEHDVNGHDETLDQGIRGESQLYNYRYGDPSDMALEKRVNHEYYDDYAANDLREQGRYDPSDVELSRNRNKDFDAMNQQLQHFPRRKPQRPQQQQQQLSRRPLNRQQRPLGPNNGDPRLQGGQGPNKEDLTSRGHKSKIHIEEKLVLNSSWPEQVLNIGQVGGLATDKDGNVYVFHRGSRIWDGRSFDYDNNFQYQDAPIMEDVVVILDSQGRLIRKFGKGLFFMPHGIHVDEKKNMWLTDVALHQVFKIPFNQSKPTLTLGKRFLHSDDLSYFCKPTDVAVLSTGEFFVTDGYCNNRVMKFSPEGKLVKSWGEDSGYRESTPKPGQFFIPHSIALSEADNLVCVADRENGRIQCFDLEGNMKRVIKHQEFGTRLFAVEYCPQHGGLLYAVNGPAFDGNQDIPVQGFTMDMKTGDLIDVWNIPQSLKNPHDVCVDPATQSVYVGELNPPAVWKLTRMNAKDAERAKAHFHDHHDDDNEPINNVKKGGTSAPLGKSQPSTTESVALASNETVNVMSKNKLPDEDPQKVTVSLVVGCLLVVPVVLVLVVALLFRGHRSGKLNWFKGSDKGKHKRVFNFQRLLGNSHKGFDPLSTEESDHDLDAEDSDHDEYTAPRKNKA